MKRNTVYVLVATIVILVSLIMSRDVQAQKLAEVYTVEGTNPDGKSYRGVLETKVEDAKKGIYSFTWWLARDGNDYLMNKGWGFIGDETLTVISADPQGGLCVIQYILNNGQWDGVWVVAGSTERGTETFTPSVKDIETLKQTLPGPGHQSL